MKVLDLFSGLGGWSEPFKERGHEILTLDNEPKFGADYQEDILTFDFSELPWKPDIILASPPCEKFSVMTIGRNWNTDHTPKTEGAKQAIKLVERTLETIDGLNPTYFIIENPRAKLRKLDIMSNLERRTVTYCQYGEKFMKPTDLWGRFPPSLILKPVCKNGAPCHISAVRGSVTGVQGGNRTKFRGGMIEDMIHLYSTDIRRQELSALRAKVPYALALDVCLSAEKDLAIS